MNLFKHKTHHFYKIIDKLKINSSKTISHFKIKIKNLHSCKIFKIECQTPRVNSHVNNFKDKMIIKLIAFKITLIFKYNKNKW